MKGWMTAERVPRDPPAEYTEATGSVVISSRVRLARNLSAFPYPGRCPADQENECRERILDAFRHLPNAEDFTILDLDQLSSLERRILFERNIVSQGYSVEKHKAMVLSSDETVAALDRRRGSPAPGRDERGRRAWTPLLARLDALDEQLEGTLQYAVSAEWGYLNTAITNLGTGSEGVHDAAPARPGDERAHQAGREGLGPAGSLHPGILQREHGVPGGHVHHCQRDHDRPRREGDHRQPGEDRRSACRLREPDDGRS